MNDNINSINSNFNSQINNINEISEETEFQKMSQYFVKIKAFQDNNYRQILQKETICDCNINGEWVVGYIIELNPSFIVIKNLTLFYEYNEIQQGRTYYSKIAYFRKYTKPQPKNIIPQREKKDKLNVRINMLLNPQYKNLFKDDTEDPIKIYDYYYFLHSTVYKAIDYSICRGKDKNSGVEEGFKTIVIVLEILSEFYHYIKNNFDEFLNYKNNIENSELADIVLFNKKYAIFSFWDDANLLMNKIFINNINYIDWFIESDNVLKTIVPSSEKMKKITSNNKLICPLYEEQITLFKFSNYNYNSRSGHNLKIKKVCIENAYTNEECNFKGYKYHKYILAYLIDYFYALGGYNVLFSLCKQNFSIKIATEIFDNILYAGAFTLNFRGVYEFERNGINQMIFKFLDDINRETLKTYSKGEIIQFFKKASSLYPSINSKSSFLFEEIYIRFILKLLTLEKKSNKIIESLNELNNILISIEYNQIFNERNYKNNENYVDTKNIDVIINDPKYQTRDKLIKEMNFSNFCLNCKDNHIIEFLFQNNKNISEDILFMFAPILFCMYKNNFGYRITEAFIEEVKNTKKLIFNTILNKLKLAEKENINVFSQIIKFITEFCEILTDEDKYFIYSEIKGVFYDSFFNQSPTFSEIFNFMINFSAIAVKKRNTYKTSLPEDNIVEQKEENDENIESLSYDENKYYGLDLIYNYLFFEQYEQLEMGQKRKLDFINTASKGIVSIVSNIRSPRIPIYITLNKICNSIKNKKDVLQHLLLLNKFLNYSKFDNFSIEFDKCFNEYLQKVEIIIIMIDELFGYLDNIEKKKIIDINDVNDINTNLNINTIQNQNKSEFEYLNDDYNIKVRIRAIFLVLLKYDKTKFDYKKLEGFFTKLVKFNNFCKDTLYQYLSENIINYSQDFLMYIYSDIIPKKELFNIYNFQTYQLYKKIIIQINKKNGSLNLMNNKDLALLITQNNIEKEFIGFNSLFNLLLNGEQNLDINIINDLTDFLCNLYFSVRIKSTSDTIKAYEEFWIHIISKLSDLLNVSSGEKNKNIKAIQSLILLIKKIINKANDENGEVIKDLKEIEKESKQNKNISNNNQPMAYTVIGNKIGYENNYILDININNTSYFYTLRYTLSNFYNIPVDQVGVCVYLNTLGKTKKITQKEMEKLYKNNFLKIFNLYNDFDNIYDELNLLLNNFGRKKYPLLLEAKFIKNNDNSRINLIDIIYKKSDLPIILMNLLKGPEEPYTFDTLCLIKENNNDSNVIFKRIIDIINNNEKNNLFNFENTSIYYVSYIINILNEIIQISIVDGNFIDKFLKSNVWNENIKNLNIFKKDNNNNENKEKIPLIEELYEKYNLINNLVNIYITVAENLGKNKENEISFFIYNIIKLYNYIINESININLNICGKSERVSIEQVKNLYNEILSNINHLIVNNEKIFHFFIKVIITNNQPNEEIKKIKYDFQYIIFENILKNKYKKINKRIKELVLDILKKSKTNNNKEENKMFYNELFNLYLNENSFEKIISIFKEINDKNISINNFRYENNSIILFDIISEVLFNSYEYIKDKFDINSYINFMLLPKVYNMFIPKMPLHSIFHQLFLGGILKIFFTLLMINYNEYNLPNEKNNELREFLYDNIIMSKCKENILTEENINNETNSISISSSFCIKEAINLFILLLFKYNNNEDISNSYINKLTELHKLCYWKGEDSSDSNIWKFYYKENQKTTQFVGLKNLGCTCYINSLLQTFYHIPLFRESLLNCEYTTNTEKNCFYQLKKVFYSLKYLLTTYYAPFSFVENYDDIVLKVNEQMDVFEFFCDFLDKIEQKLKHTNNENIIKYFFMGRQNDVLTFEGNCNHHRTNESQFYSIQLQVQGKKDIYDSLNTLIEGEKMQGDNCIHCPKCDKKLPAIKSQNFKTLPRIFMFVLKRFKFNYETMQKIKINDYYEFPLILDMNKYTDKFINNNISEDNMYKLKSIIIHTGTCESGHYYSYILDDKSKEWYEFNDTRVQKINIDMLDVEAYGKCEVINDNGVNIEVENTRNAYILFYEKINKDNCEKFDKIEVINNLLIGNINQKNKPKKNIVNDIKEEDFSFNLISNDNPNNDNNNINNININEIDTNKKEKSGKIKGFQDILNPINKEMYKYFLNQRLFSAEYHCFILSLYINMFNKYSKQNLSFSQSLCNNRDHYILTNEIKNFRSNRKALELSNLENYLIKRKIFIVEKSYNNINDIGNSNNDNENKILELFKHLIIYFFNVMIRSRERDYLGGTVNLIKFFINNYIFCSDYIIEEFSTYNFLVEYMINCPLYNLKKLIVGILYCAMIKSINTYEGQKRAENNNLKKQQPTNSKQTKNNATNNNKKNENKKKKEQEMSDEEMARKLQEQFNMEYSGGHNSYMNNNMSSGDSDTDMNSNPLERKYIPPNVVKLIYNTLFIIRKIRFSNLNESRFLYNILYRFSLVSKKTKKFLLNKAFVLEFLNILLLSDIKEEPHDDEKILNTMNKGLFTVSHSILDTSPKKEINARYDKGGAFHYENYTNLLYFYLLSHIQKDKPKNPYFEGSFNFDNKRFVKALFFRINTKQDAYGFFYLLWMRYKTNKNYKKKIDFYLYNIINILNRSDNNEKINYDRNSNRDNYYKGAYSENTQSSFDYENDFPKINPKYTLLIFKRFIILTSKNKNIDEYRINICLSQFWKLFEANTKYYNYTIMLIDFITELFTNYKDIMSPYINPNIPNFKLLIQWLRNNPISPELYPIEGISMFKDDNVAYKQNITEEEKIKFNNEQTKKTEKRIQKIINIAEINFKEYDYEYEVDFDLTDFKFRKGDYIFYKNKKAVIKEALDELILIKIIDNDMDKNEKKDNKNDEEKYSIIDMEKIKFWVPKDDKNISVYNLE